MASAVFSLSGTDSKCYSILKKIRRRGCVGSKKYHTGAKRDCYVLVVIIAYCM